MLAAWLVAGLLWSGCSSRKPAVDSFEVFRPGWDSAEVALRFVDRPLLGSGQVVAPDSVRFVLFSADYDTLYAGSVPSFVIRDRLLSDEEPLLLEACGMFGTGSVCDQKRIAASPKRVRSNLRVRFPSEPERAVAIWTVQPIVERQRFGTLEWESLEGAEVPDLSVMVEVERGEGTPLRFSLSGTDGAADLALLDGYPAFRYDLRSTQRDSGFALVRFSVVATYGDLEKSAGSTRLTVRSLPEEEQLREISVLVESAARILVERLFDPAATARAFVFVNEWEYDAERAQYVAEIEVHRRQGLFGRWDEAIGRLWVGIDGSLPVFRLEDAREPVRNHWRVIAPGDSLSLPSLPDPRIPDVSRPRPR